MNNYSFNMFVPSNWRIIAKYCLELDQKIISVQDYIDFSNPNKIILNYVYNSNEIAFYNTEELVQLNILRKHSSQCQHFSNFSDLYNIDSIYETANYNIETEEFFILQNQLYKVNFLPPIFYNYQALVDYYAHTGDCEINELVLLAEEGYMFLITELDQEDVSGIRVANNYKNWYSSEEVDIYGINIDQLYPGQIVYNNFGNDITVYPTTTSPDLDDNYNQLTQGMAIFKILDEEKNYQIIALDSTGDFYIFANVDANGVITFELLPHATVDFGLDYLFSMVASNVRWCDFGSDALITHTTLRSPGNWETFNINAWSWNYELNKREYYIISPYATLWTISSVISNDIMAVNNDIFEEISCKTSNSVSSQGIDKGSQSIYTINTNIDKTIADFLNLRVILY